MNSFHFFKTENYENYTNKIGTIKSINDLHSLPDLDFLSFIDNFDQIYISSYRYNNGMRLMVYLREQFLNIKGWKLGINTTVSN